MAEPTIDHHKFFDLSGKKALVTGAGRGIGKMMIEAHSAGGCRVDGALG